MRPLFLLLLVAMAFFPAQAQQGAPKAPARGQIDYPGFVELTEKLAGYREKRLINLEAFNKAGAEKDAVILDTRSVAAFRRGHIDGAINLPFSDFTDAKLAKVLGNNKSRKILIYCNNNFSNNVPPVMLKRSPLALNIPTFINLYGYGYQNIYELAGSYNVSDPALKWISS